MRKLVALCVAACMTIFLVACGDSGTVEDDFSSSEPVSTPAASSADNTISESASNAAISFSTLANCLLALLSERVFSVRAINSSNTSLLFWHRSR